jgi:hypothetical protein
MGGHQAKGDSAGPVGEGASAQHVGRRARSRPVRWRPAAADPDERDRPPELTEEQILAWVEAHQARTGNWPTVVSGAIDEAPGETWREVDRAMRFGLRGLPGYSSLARLVARARGADEERRERSPLTVRGILRWAEAHHARTGGWPDRDSGPIPESPGDTWLRIDVALRGGRRRLPGGATLAGLLARHRRALARRDRPPLSEEQILAWADAHHARTGKWPTVHSGRIPAARGETWGAVQSALYRGLRGLPGGSSLARLLQRRREAKPKLRRPAPPLTIPQILAWVDTYHARTGRWPRFTDGPIPEEPGETWSSVNSALQQGTRGLPGGSSLPRLLRRERDVHRAPHRAPYRPPLTIPDILRWADAHLARTGRWPKARSGPISEAPGETWRGVHKALQAGLRSLPGGSSLARLLHERRGTWYWSRGDRSPLTIPQILAWADAFRGRTGRWPRIASGPIPEAPGESWRAVNAALAQGLRGLPGGSSLPRLLDQERGVRDQRYHAPLTIPQVLAWADAFRGRTGRWPTVKSGPIPEAPGETWRAVDGSLKRGWRGLPGGSTLARLLDQERGPERRGPSRA